ncbi:hypothetical protein NEOKW01_1801 [Nematocida sp. AWRm80]|nr:hypothetical protein NEOKW01_1801 [Nematocida sp. AWRm80]
MSKVQLDSGTFKKRIEKIREYLGEEIGGLMISIGKRDDSYAYGINAGMFLYLLGYEFPETMLIVKKEDILVVTSAKKSTILEQLNSTIAIKTLVRMKDGSNQESINQTIKAELQGKPLGILQEERGDLVKEWENAQETKDITAQIEPVFLEKDTTEKELLRLSGLSISHISSLLENKIRQVIKTDDRVIHEELSEKIEGDLEMEIRKLPQEVDQSYLELCFKPIIQSGGRYQVDKSPRGEFINPYHDQLLYFDTISYYLWIAYKGYCTMVGRTLLVSPNKKGEAALKACITLMDHIIRTVTTTQTYAQIRTDAKERLEQIADPEYRQELISSFKLDIGQSIGIRPEEGPAPESFSNMQPINNMAFVVSVRFENLTGLDDTEEITCTIHMDNVLLMENTHAKVLTPFSIRPEDYILEKIEEKTKRTQLGRRVRNRDKELERANEINEHQRQLMDELIEEQLEHYKQQENPVAEKEETTEKRYISYQKETQLPRGLPVIKIDKRASTVILPVFGMAVPFHIGIIKSATKTTEEGVGYLKISFYPPSAEATSENNLLSIMIKDSQENITAAWKDINTLKKDEETPEEDMIEEGEKEELQISSGRIETLQNIYIKYDHRTGTKKNDASTAELHKNGLRYYSKQAGEIHIFFSQIKHMFYQPGAAESPTLIHFRLSAPLVINGKKTNDIQFFRDCMANAVHDTRKTRNMPGGEEAELYEEEEEERMREEINDIFYEFAEKIARQSRIILEEPLTKGFYGVPFKQSVLIQPTSECLVNLTEYPFFVLPFKDIEILNFERRISGVTTCDLAFVLKDKTQAVVHVYGVSSSYVTWLMDFFDSKNICFTETKVNIQWNNVLKSILEDPIAFYEGGAWAILQPSRETRDEEESNDTDVVDLETTEEEFTSNEDFATDDDPTASETEEEDSEDLSYAETESGNDSFVVEESEEEKPKKKHRK